MREKTRNTAVVTKAWSRTFNFVTASVDMRLATTPHLNAEEAAVERAIAETVVGERLVDCVRGKCCDVDKPLSGFFRYRMPAFRGIRPEKSVRNA
jgi:hypothetical protein